MAVSREKFDKARARYLAADEALDAFKNDLTRHYGKYQNSWLTRTQQKKLEALDERRDKASDAMFALIAESSPRDWRSGVPLHWIVTELSYEDTFRPLNEPLSVTPPLAYGHTQHMRNSGATMHSNAGQLDETAAHELELYITNEAALFGPRSQAESIRKNLLRKMKAGSFDTARSVDAWMYLVEAGAKRYAKEYADPSDWSRMFSVPTRREVARTLAEEFETEAKLGNYHLNPSEPPPPPRRRRTVDPSLGRVRQIVVREERPFDPERSYGRSSKRHHFAVNATDPRDIPQHLRAIKFDYHEAPEANGEQLSYGHFDAGKERGDKPQWYEVEYASGSDYSGGTVNRSNYEVLRELLEESHPSGQSPAVWADAYGGHGTYAILVVYDALDPDLQQSLGALEDYPLLDEEHHSMHETEKENEAWENAYQSEFEEKLLKAVFEDGDDAEWPEDADSFALFRLRAEVANENWEHSAEGPYIDLDRIVDAFAPVLTGDKKPPTWMSGTSLEDLEKGRAALGL